MTLQRRSAASPAAAMGLLILLVALAPLLLAAPLRAETASLQLGFADTLFAEGDYYRAVSEYKRYLYLQPDSPHAAQAHLNLARASLLAGRSAEGRQALDALIASHPASPQAAAAQLLLAEIPFRQQQYQQSHQLLQQPLTDSASTFLRQHQQRLSLWNLLHGEQYPQALALWHSDPAIFGLEEADLQALQQRPRKSPALAGSLSAVLPGAGQLYNGRYREAGLALALNAAFLLGGLQAIDTGNSILGGILLFFEAGWYGGNIYNAMNSAHKFNRDQHQTALDALKQRSGFSLLTDDKQVRLQFDAHFD
ncbi:MAG: tetratricopeptide repeat protein [Desulfuromonas thiophila]|nr:tetratricopeptide repeat protein [Desulfuromonas thiophila]